MGFKIFLRDAQKVCKISTLVAAFFVLPLIITPLFFAADKTHAQTPSSSLRLADGVIVELKTRRGIQSLDQAKEGLVADLGADADIVDTVDELNLALIKDRDADRDIQSLITSLESNDLIARVEPNLMRTFAYVPNDGLFGNQWALHNTGQSVNGSSGNSGADISAVSAWDSENISSNTTIVAVIDTGVEYTHPDLITNMWNGSSCRDEFNNIISGGCPHHGWNYENNNNDPIDINQANSSFAGHGTFAASVIGAINSNATGISGSSRYNKLDIMALRFNFDVFSEIKAINFAKNNGAKVINASYGGGGFSQIESDAIASFPGIFVAAAGNGGSDFVGDNNDVSNFYPCNYNLSNVVCVAASNQEDELASFSNYGTSSVDIAAPGVNILGIYRGDYLYGNGTSFAAPFVSAAAGLAYSNTPSASISDVRNLILSQADTVSTLDGNVSGNRRLNIAKMLGTPIVTTPTPSDPAQQNTYRFYSANFRSHFYTTSNSERDLLISNDPNWAYEGSVFRTYKSAVSSTVRPVYRFYSEAFRSHFYTISASERDGLINGDPNWSYEGISYYAQTAAEGTPLFRFFSPNFRSHFYTTSTGERDGLINGDPNWIYEGIAYYLPS